MSFAHGIRIAFLVFSLQPMAGLLACQFDPPGMSHEQWVKWVDDRDKANDLAMKQKAEGNPDVAKVKKPEAEEQGRGGRRTFAGDRRTTNGGAVNNVVNLRR